MCRNRLYICHILRFISSRESFDHLGEALLLVWVSLVINRLQQFFSLFKRHLAHKLLNLFGID
jgi:hypothetical protein